jgi:hypothetical protein
MTPQTDPEFLPFKLDLVARRVLLVRLTAQQRREASFLDADNSWRTKWGGARPRAIRLRLTLSGHGRFERIYYLP